VRDRGGKAGFLSILLKGTFKEIGRWKLLRIRESRGEDLHFLGPTGGEEGGLPERGGEVKRAT